MSKGPLAASSARMASSRASAVASASHSDPSVCRWTARSIPGAGARDIRAASAAIDDPLSVPRQDRLSPQHVALLTGLRRVVVHRKGAEDRQRILLAMPQVRGLADEVLLLDPRRGHPRLDHV